MLLALGSNVASSFGNPSETLRVAVELLKKRDLVIRKISRFYRTPAFPAGNGPDYVNAAAELICDCDAATALAHLHAVEGEMERTRELRWGQRTLDLDLLAMGDSVLPDAAIHQYWRDLPLDMQKTLTPEQLILPHPRLQDRGFVLVPLMDVAPDWRHPLLGKTVRQLCAALPEAAKNEVIALD
ncbi:2-amino-4-hydroxy-6-hydroxymethyldihydropteridine diphosphokinase [Sulfitobacter sp. SK012]|uniref:2-amino-4-hydroxy-6- hydroxymethyldihydropteridine diphosphokinase n=1 Tax=Sulfitobacter sp. SK012 TaxID=1389005 RepID=UPI000E0AF950|nr:2-amino-4-hydroxy-6-hydroxymethyldihydropteridine diphosphokinase [Sulfitobacter sp. SK012]AXI45057.1 2-amino-4-hydroxy-6-hydroxymethyldihydropteridine diphosphokinase [Sulfitobacter sp. SK012]